MIDDHKWCAFWSFVSWCLEKHALFNMIFVVRSSTQRKMRACKNFPLRTCVKRLTYSDITGTIASWTSTVLQKLNATYNIIISYLQYVTDLFIVMRILLNICNDVLSYICSYVIYLFIQMWKSHLSLFVYPPLSALLDHCVRMYFVWLLGIQDMHLR